MMRSNIPDSLLYKLADGSKNTCFRAQVDRAVSIRFRSVHYLSSISVADCITLNLLLNDKITPYSADTVIASMRRKNRSFYTTTDSAFRAISDRFDEYAKQILGDDRESVLALGMRSVNYIVYVISLDLSANAKLNKNEILYTALDYDELREYRDILSND